MQIYRRITRVKVSYSISFYYVNSIYFSFLFKDKRNIVCRKFLECDQHLDAVEKGYLSLLMFMLIYRMFTIFDVLCTTLFLFMALKP